MPPSALETLLRAAPPDLAEIGFTGGEPFMNPDIITLLTTALAAEKSVLVLTNAMRPMQRHQPALGPLIARHGQRLALRVSLDHHDPARHDDLRGKASFASSLAGLKYLVAADARLSVASRTPWGDTEAAMRAGFAALFRAEAIPLDAQNPADLILFPEMDTSSPAAPITQAALAAVPPEKPLMCATSRMAVLRKGETVPRIAPCTLLPDETLPRIHSPVRLDHPHCAQFCVHGGASCAGAPG
jgi:hypothetical protein